MNYSLYGDHSFGTSDASAYLELGLFNRWGVLTSTEAGNDIVGSNSATAAPAAGTVTSPSKWVRLETTFTQDHPDSATTLKLGDAITNGGMSGLAVRFGGIQYGTNFATQPYFIPFPLPSYQGSAQLPSTVNVYVNGVLQGSQQVQPGVFSIPQVPTATGPGVMTVAVRNAIGQEQVVSLPFYSTTELLKDGLNDYSFSVGKLRNDFGVVSNDYGPTLGTAVVRHGFSDTFTGEARAEATSGESAVSLGGAYGTHNLGVVSGSLASSHSTSLGSGTMAELGMQRSGDVISFGADARVTNSRFTELGYFGLPAPKRQATANLGVSLGHAGDVTVAYINQYLPLVGQQQLATGTYSVNVGRSGFFTFTAYRVLTGPAQSGFVAMLTFPFGERSSVSGGVARNNDHYQPFAQVQESLPPGTGMGYHAAAELGPDAQTEADVDYQNDVGVYSLGATHSLGSTLYQASVTGGIGFIGSDWFAARYIPGSFGLVRLPGFPNVPVYDNNLPVARTDSHGDAILPNLQPYTHNTVTINPTDLPLDAESDTYNMDAVPYYRSGVVMQFPVKTVKAATFTLRQANGALVPAGAMLTLAGQSEQFPVGYEGQAYVTGFAAGVKATAEWEDHRCEFTLPPSTSTDAVPDLGAVVCKEVKAP
jgi:outer membrane usher protein